MHIERRTRTFLLITTFTLLSSIAQAQGPFQATGQVTEVGREGDTITFRFSGRIDFGFASTSARDASREWKDVHFDVSNLRVQVKDWSEPYRPGQRAASDEVARAHQKLLDVAALGEAVGISIDNPSLTFSNTGELVLVSGTFVYAVPKP